MCVRIPQSGPAWITNKRQMREKSMAGAMLFLMNGFHGFKKGGGKMKDRKKVAIRILAVLVILLAMAVVLIGVMTIQKKKYDEQLSLGDKYLAKLDYENAEICFRKAISIQDKKAAPYLKLAAVYLYQGRTQEAEDILREGSEKVTDSQGLEKIQENLKTLENSDERSQNSENADVSQQNEKDEKEENERTVREEEATDGSFFVCYQGNWYYRKYSAENYEKEGIFGSYQEVEGQSKEMICLTAQGEKKVLFSDNGGGDIYIVKDRMILTDQENPWSSSSYVTDFQGTVQRRLENCYPVASDRERGLVFFQTPQGGFFAWEAETDTVKNIKDDGGSIWYQGCWEDTLYYTTQENGQKDTVLWALELNSLEKRQVSVFSQDSVLDTTYIVSVQVLGEQIFVLTGGYGGSAGMFQGGKIYRVNLDGSDKQQVAGGSGEYGTCGEEFCVFEENGQWVLYYTDFESGEARRLVAGGTGEFTDLTPWQLGEYFYDSEGGISIYPDESGETLKLLYADELSQELYGSQLNRYGETYCTVKELSFCGDQILYTVESGSHQAAGDMGWRYNYRREASRSYRMDSNSREKTLLYEY